MLDRQYQNDILTKLAGQPFAIAEKLGPCAVDQQVQGSWATAIRVLDRDPPLSAAQVREVWHRPVEVSQLQDAGNHPCRLPKGKTKLHLYHEAGLHRGTPADAPDVKP